MAQAVGWLSWLGESTFDAGRGAANGGGVLTCTLVLRNDGPVSITASVSNTLPLNVTLVPSSLTGGASYDAPERRVSWLGPLQPGERVTVTYRVTVAVGVPAGVEVANTACLRIEEQMIAFDRAAVVRVGGPDLDPSTFGCAPAPARPGDAVTCTLALANAGPGDALTATVGSLLPSVPVVPGSLHWEGGGVAEVVTGTVHWTGTISVHSRVTVTYQLSLPAGLVQPPLYSVAFIEDGAGGAWERSTWLWVEPFRFHLPMVLR